MAIKSLTAPHCKIMIGDVVIGSGNNITITNEVTLRDVEVLDRIRPLEIVPTKVVATGTISLVRLKAETLTSLGVYPEATENADVHRVNVLSFVPVSIYIYNSLNGKAVLKVVEAMLGTSSYRITAHEIVMYDVEFRGQCVIESVAEG